MVTNPYNHVTVIVKIYNTSICVPFFTGQIIILWRFGLTLTQLRGVRAGTQARFDDTGG